MKYNPRKHNRHSIRLKNYDYSSPGLYFITLNTKNREQLFGQIKDGEMILNEFGQIVDNFWREIPDRFVNVQLHKYVVMPDHFHGIIEIKYRLPDPKIEKETDQTKKRRKMLIPKIIGRFKMRSAKEINLLRGTQGTKVWQRDYWEHIIRDKNEYTRITNYIKNNPKNWENAQTD